MQQGQFFDATQFEISNGGLPQHPDGKFPAYVSASGVEPTKEKDGNFLAVTFTTPAGEIVQRYNLWNNNPQAVDIAQKQLTALCYATGIFKLDLQNQGREFHNAKLQIEVRKQKSNPNFSEVARVFDVNGNEPTKQGGGGQQTQQTQQNGNGGGGFGQQPQQQPANNAPPPGFAPANNQPPAGSGNVAGWSPANQGGGNSGGGQPPQSSAPWGPK